MSMRFLLLARRFSQSAALRLPALSDDYKSSKLWNERFACKFLGDDEELIKQINSKIISGSELNNLDLDVFINVAVPRPGETDQLVEVVKQLYQMRNSIQAGTILPSIHHSFCRLFLASEQLPCLATILDNRIKFGIFPDFFALNLLLDKSLMDNNLALAARFATLPMLQEEFGINPLTDAMSLYSVAKYIESGTDFSDWGTKDLESQPIIKEALRKPEDELTTSGQSDVKQTESEDDEEDEDQYIRIPFLRNPYDDAHFDLENPRQIIGKTLTMLAAQLMSKGHEEHGLRAHLLGSLLYGDWKISCEMARKLASQKMSSGPMEDTVRHYLENLHGLPEPSSDEKDTLIATVGKIKSEGYLSELAENHFNENKCHETKDIADLRKFFEECSRGRLVKKLRVEKKTTRERLIRELEIKEEKLREKEQFLYFYDNLKERRVTRIEYK